MSLLPTSLKEIKVLYNPRNELTVKLSTVICSTTAFYHEVNSTGTPPACKEISYLQSLYREKSVQVNKPSCITCCLMYIDEEAKKNIGNKLGILRILKWVTWAVSRLSSEYYTLYFIHLKLILIFTCRIPNNNWNPQ